MKEVLFDDVYDIDASEQAMQVLASDLVLLLKHCDVTREELATKLECNVNYVARILSGDVNMSIHDITVIAEVLGYTFDIIFHNEEHDRPQQPWVVDRQ